ncbi:MAG: PH domain-containing protein [Phycisphaeraceae bacterium]|nr:PH domain-containing protein [Phycisphaeraceae bacterium]
MIRLRCDRCDRELEVDDDLAGRKVECPHCGDVNVVPEPAAEPSQSTVPSPARAVSHTDRAAAAGFPPDHGPEAHVLKVRPAMFRAKPFAFSGLCIALLVGIIIWFMCGPIMARSPRWLSWVGLMLLVGGGIGLAIWKTLTLASSLEVTTKRSVQQIGLFSKSTSEVLHDSIRNVQVDQSFLDRICRVGRVSISSSGQDDLEICVRDLPNPNRIREIIDLYRPLDRP